MTVAPAFASEPAAAPAAGGAGGEHADMVAKWMEMAAPDEHHERFKKMVGKWTTRMRVWMEGPDKPPMESTGSCTFELLLGGRFLMQQCDGKFFGMPHEGIGIEGYDRFKKRYTSIWMDNMGTAIMQMTGSCAKDGKSCMFFGEMDEPMTGEIGKIVKATSREISKDKGVFEMFDSAFHGDEWTRVMEIEYNRAR